MLAPKLGRRAFVQGLTGVPLAAILANPTGARYDEADAKLAWSRTLAFFGQHLG